MAQKLKKLVCLYCGGDMKISEDGKTAKCLFCKKEYQIGSSLSDSSLIDFSMATEYWKTFRFADAKRKFLDVVKEDETFSEAYWGAFVSEYGIEWGENSFGDIIPTCHRAHTVSVYDDKNYQNAIEYASDKSEYEELASKIEEVRKEIIEKSKEESNYDVFICFKATEEEGGRKRKTDDFELGREIYNELTSQGYKVFFSPETLMRVREQEFEPYIFKALSTARVMFLLCSSNEKIESAWVKNEWGRFLDMKNGAGLIPVCGNKYELYSPASLPTELRKLNAIEYGVKLLSQIGIKLDAYFPEKVKAREKAELLKKEKEIEERLQKEREKDRQEIEKLQQKLAEQEKKEQEERLKKETAEREKREKELEELRGLIKQNAKSSDEDKFLKQQQELEELKKQLASTATQSVQTQVVDSNGISVAMPYVKRGNKLLEKGDFSEAFNEFDIATDYDETCADAWLGKLLCNYKLKKAEDFLNTLTTFDHTSEFKNFAKFCTNKEKLKSVKEINVLIRAELKRKEEEKRRKEEERLAKEKARREAKEKARREAEEIAKSFDIRKGVLVEYIGTDEEVVIPESIVKIGVGAFRGCKFIKKVTMPDSVTEVGAEAFYNCNGLSSITLSKNLTVIDQFAFCHCESLKTITLPDSLKNIYADAFYGCASLSKIIIPKNVVVMGVSAFECCTSLKTVEIIGELDVLNSKCFRNCQALVNIAISKSCKKIEYNCFKSCGSLESIVIPDTVEEIGESVFEECTKLSKVELGKCIKNISKNAFEKCDNLKEVVAKCSFKKIAGIFNKKTNIIDKRPDELVKLEAEEKAKKDAAGIARSFNIKNGVLVKYKGKGGNVVIPDTVTSIGKEAFEECESLTSITIPNSVTSIGNRAFVRCRSLENIAISKAVTSIGEEAFRDCDKLKSINIPDSVTSIGEHAFAGCSLLTSITIPSGITNIAKEMFYGCKSLTSVVIPDSVTSIGAGAFAYCYSLKSITIPNGVTSIWTEAFQDCYSLKSVEIPDSVTSIGAWAFCHCNSLTSITIPSGIMSIREGMFYGFNSLTSVVIPDSVTSIGEHAFGRCHTLTSVEIPESVKEIAKDAFDDCSKDLVITVHYKGLFQPKGWEKGWNGDAKVKRK